MKSTFSSLFSATKTPRAGNPFTVCQNCRDHLGWPLKPRTVSKCFRAFSTSMRIFRPELGVNKPQSKPFVRSNGISQSSRAQAGSLEADLAAQDLPSNMRFTPAPAPPTPKSANSSETLLSIFSREPTKKEDSPEIPEWKLRKAAIRNKIGDQRWNPPRKVSPDAQRLIRALNAENPDMFTPTALRKHFGISFESVRRILQSKWEPTDEQLDKQRKAWHERGKTIWSALAAEGHKPPAKWRREGVGRIRKGVDLDGIPSWKRYEYTRRKWWWENEVEGKALGLVKRREAGDD